ncbi:Phosphoglycolate phosphatase [Roseovarius sp. THAF8]|uniref:HAD family hydrolase n=1 Tax=Roseovarius sp. THAF8 TaxID=2587846 RepID=UPI0012682555|nr:HAD-IA family hydrolase [Roseovarius sp. THAF8]QFT96707.1 Phosphoglycolate phosphatase [Roseovarius sp. THAF8]
MNKPARKVDGLLFDKDGTLFDFHTTWSAWAGDLIEDLAQGDAAVRARLASEMHYDLDERRFRPTSPIVAGTNREAAECVARAVPDRRIEELETFLMETSAAAPQAETVPLAAFLQALAAEGLALGVATNDTEHGARAHLGKAGVVDQFDFIAGFDSGHGAKPAPGPCLAFARAMGLAPGRVAMVGDSTHDLLAGRAAGMQTVAVLTGTATRADLAPFADVVLPDIGHIPAWMIA